MTMQIRRSIFGFVIIIAALIALVLWYGEKQKVETPPTIAIAESNAAPPAARAASAPVSVPTQPNAPVVNTTKGADLSKSPPMSKAERTIGLLSTYNDVPIDFYGRVEDQFSNAVAYATINFNVRVYNGYESTVKRGQVTADENGYFSITGYKGQDLGLVPHKAGYALATMGTLFKYSHMEDHPFVSDPDSPAVIKMWKLQGAGPLVNIDQHYKLHYTDTPMNFDLLTGQIVPAGGDIKLTVSRSPGAISGRNRLDWSVQIEAVNGGVMDSSGQEAVTYAAPDSGYAPEHDLYFLDQRAE